MTAGGVMAQYGVVMVSYFNQLVREGSTLEEAVTQGAMVRLRSRCPLGTRLAWAGQFEYYERAKERRTPHTGLPLASGLTGLAGLVMRRRHSV